MTLSISRLCIFDGTINDELGTIGLIKIGKGNRNARKTPPSTILSTKNPIRPDLGLKPGRHNRRPASCGMAISISDPISIA
jgi:hypothetical protein